VRDLERGSYRTSSGDDLWVTEPVGLGHKVAVRDIARGRAVKRYGMSIGSAVADIPRGAWIHTHNLASDYLATFAHRGGER